MSVVDMRDGNRSADRSAVVVLLIERPLVCQRHRGIAGILREPQLVEVVIRIQIFVLEYVIDSAVVLVRTTSG